MGLQPVTYQFAYDVERLCADQGVAVNNLVHVPESPEDNYSLAYGQLVIPLVQAVQEQQAQIASLQAEVETLKKLLPNAPGEPATTRLSTGRNASVFPNPATDALNLRLAGFFGQNEMVAVVLTDAAGRAVLREKVDAEKPSAILLPKDLAPGHYAVTVQAENGELLFSGLIMKQ